eukprot:1156156-Pelagomonas_calceolata.AAC.10
MAVRPAHPHESALLPMTLLLTATVATAANDHSTVEDFGVCNAEPQPSACPMRVAPSDPHMVTAKQGLQDRGSCACQANFALP